MGSALGGFGAGLAQGVNQLNNTVDYLEKVRQNREEMRLKFNQDRRNQETHDAKMEQMGIQLEQLQKAQFKSNLMDEIRAMDFGNKHELSPAITQSPFYQSMFQDYVPVDSSIYGPEYLQKIGIAPEQAKDYFVFKNNQGEIVPIRKDALYRMTGYADQRAKESADIAKNERMALGEQNLMGTQELYDRTVAYMKANWDSLSLEDKIKLTAVAQNLAPFNGKIPSTTSDRKSFASQDSAEMTDKLAKIRKGDISTALVDSVATMAKSSAQQDTLIDALMEGIAYKGLDTSKYLTAEERAEAIKNLPPEQQMAILNTLSRAISYANTYKRDLVKQGEKLFTDTTSHLSELAKLEDKGARKDFITANSDSIRGYLPDDMLSSWQNGNMINDQFKVLSQLVINAYGHENFGSALTETESGKIDAVFGSGWANTRKFLLGATAIAEAKLAEADKVRQTMGPRLFDAVYGPSYKKLMTTVENLKKFQGKLNNYHLWIEERKKKGNTKDLTFKTYNKDLEKQEQIEELYKQAGSKGSVSAPASGPSLGDKKSAVERALEIGGF